MSFIQSDRVKKPLLMRLPGKKVPEKPALEAVFETEESPLLRYAFGIVGRRELAEEVVQDAFLKLHEHWEEVEVPRAWLFRCVRNLSINLLRKHKRGISDDSAASQAPDPKSERPDDERGRLEAVGMVQMLVAEMKGRDREMVTLKYFEDLKYHEIAERLEMSVGNVGYRLHHLLKQLAERLRKSGIEGDLL